MAESPDHEIQMELHVEQEQCQGDVPDDTSVYSDTHSVRGTYKPLLIDHFINCAEIGRRTNQDNMLGLSANLRGPARILYMSLFQDERADYYRLVDNLAQRMGSAREQISGSVNFKLGNDSRGNLLLL